MHLHPKVDSGPDPILLKISIQLTTPSLHHSVESFVPACPRPNILGNVISDNAFHFNYEFQQMLYPVISNIRWRNTSHLNALDLKFGISRLRPVLIACVYVLSGTPNGLIYSIWVHPSNTIVQCSLLPLPSYHLTPPPPLPFTLPRYLAIPLPCYPLPDPVTSPVARNLFDIFRMYVRLWLMTWN